VLGCEYHYLYLGQTYQKLMHYIDQEVSWIVDTKNWQECGRCDSVSEFVTGWKCNHCAAV